MFAGDEEGLSKTTNGARKYSRLGVRGEETEKAPGSLTPPFFSTQVCLTWLMRLASSCSMSSDAVDRGGKCLENALVALRLTKTSIQLHDLRSPTITYRVAGNDWAQIVVNVLVLGSAPVSNSPRFWPDAFSHRSYSPTLQCDPLAGCIINGDRSIPFAT